MNSEPKILSTIHAFILGHPKKLFRVADIAAQFQLGEAEAEKHLEYLSDIERELDPQPSLKGVMKSFLRGEAFYEAVSENPDVRRDYDFRATNDGGRDFSPKNMFYYTWAWINLLEDKCRRLGIENNRIVLLTHDCRYYPPEIVTAVREAALLRGYRVRFAFGIDRHPSCVSSYSHAVRLTKPAMAVFITASHVSRPIENTVVGAKVSMVGAKGSLESLTTQEIKIKTAEHIYALKGSRDLSRLVNRSTDCQEIAVDESHTRLAVAAVLSTLGHFGDSTLYDLSAQLKAAPDMDGLLRSMIPSSVPQPFRSLRVVIDGAHTTSGLLAEQPLRALGATTTLLNGDIRAVAGPHQADPSITSNLQALFNQMAETKAHMGLAFDLDGDRGAIVLPDRSGFTVLSPDKLGQVLMPFLMNEGGYRKAEKPLYVRDCLSTDAVLDQGRLSHVTVETTDAGYVFLKKREGERAAEGFVAIAMGEASGHAWLDFTGPFENPIVLALLFAAMSVKRWAEKSSPENAGQIPQGALHSVFSEAAIPYRKSPRFQPLFAPQLMADAARDPRNDTGWTPETHLPVPQKIISLCRSASIEKLKGYFTQGRTFQTALGELEVHAFEDQWDEEEKIFRFGKIYFLLNGVPAGSFVSRGSSNDPTAVQVWEVKEFDGLTWSGQRVSEETAQQRFDLVGGLVLSVCAECEILELVDRKPAANLAAVLPSVTAYKRMVSPGL